MPAVVREKEAVWTRFLVPFLLLMHHANCAETL